MPAIFAAVSASVTLNVYAALTDPEWATPVNTFLLLALGLLALHGNRKVEQVARKTDSAAESAASAAAAAADAARIARDIGGRMREADKA